MQRRRTLLISEAGALFGSDACQFAAVSQWSCLVRGWTASFLRQFSNNPALNTARTNPIGCAPPRVRACGGAPAASPRHRRNTQPRQHTHGCAVPLDVRRRARTRARATAHQTCQPHAGVGYTTMAAYSPEVSSRRWKNTQPGQQMHQEGQPDIAEIRSPGKQIHRTRRRPINFHSLSERLDSLA